MGPAIGSILPTALGVAISPIPIIAAILMLLSPRARATGVGFLVGWLAGIVVALVVFMLLASVLPTRDSGAGRPIHGVIQLVLGILLVLLAIRRWRGRPRGEEKPTMPKWMRRIDSLGFPGALALGFALSGLNPKNLIMSASAGVTIGGAGLAVGASAVVAVVYVVLAACTVAAPVIAYLAAPGRVAAPLDALRGWLERQNALIMAVLLLVIGVVVIGKGIGSF